MKKAFRKSILSMRTYLLLGALATVSVCGAAVAAPKKPDLKVEAGANPTVEDPAPLSSEKLPTAAPIPTPSSKTTVIVPPPTETPAPPKTVTPEPVKPEPKPEPTKPSAPVKKATDSLRPGQFVFEKHDSYDGPLKIVAVLDIQRVYVYMDDKLIAFSTISGGKKGKETPTGYFNILQKNIDHKSNIYSNAPMPFMQRLTWDGIALHAGHIPAYNASHGCIRMPMAFAKSLYGITKMGQEVLVLQNLTSPRPARPAPVVPVVKPPVVTPPVVTPPVTTPAVPAIEPVY